MTALAKKAAQSATKKPAKSRAKLRVVTNESVSPEGDVHFQNANQGSLASRSPSHDIGGQESVDSLPCNASDVTPSGAVGLESDANLHKIASRANSIAVLRQFVRRYKTTEKSRIALGLQIHAVCRRIADEHLPESTPQGKRLSEQKKLATDLHKRFLAHRKAVKKWAAKENGKMPQITDDALRDVAFHAQTLMELFDLASRRTDAYEKVATRYCEESFSFMAPFIEATRGFTWHQLAVIIGEAGDLSNYATKERLWKRMGLAPHQKGDKNHAGSTWRMLGGLTAKEWEEVGYSPRRRSVAWTAGDVVLRAQLRKDKGGVGEGLGDAEDTAGKLIALGEIGQAALDYKARKLAEYADTGILVAPAAKLKGMNPDTCKSLIHLQRMTARYATKRLFWNLWKFWRSASNH